jgi:hypothetical protein
MGEMATAVMSVHRGEGENTAFVVSIRQTTGPTGHQYLGDNVSSRPYCRQRLTFFCSEQLALSCLPLLPWGLRGKSACLVPQIKKSTGFLPDQAATPLGNERVRVTYLLVDAARTKGENCSH